MSERLIGERDINAAATWICIRIEEGAADTQEALQLMKSEVGNQGIVVQEFVQAANAYNVWNIRPWTWGDEDRTRLDAEVQRIQRARANAEVQRIQRDRDWSE